MKILKTLLLSFIICVMLFTTVYAENSTDESGMLDFVGNIDMSTLQYETDDGTIKYDDDFLSHAVTYVLLDSTCPIEKASDFTDDMFSYVIAMGDSYVDENGEYSFSLKINKKSGVYYLLINNFISDKELYEIDHVLVLHNVFNETDDADTIESYLLDYYEALKFDKEGFEILSDLKRQEVLEAILNAPEFSSDDEIIELLDSIKIYDMVFEGETSDELLADYVEKRNKAGDDNFTGALFTKWLSMDNDYKIESVRTMFNSTDREIDEDALRFSIVKNIAENLEYVKVLEEIVFDENGVYKTSEVVKEDYKTADTSDVLSDLLSAIKSASDYDEVIEALEASVKKHQISDLDTSSGSGGKKSGGSSGKATYTAPIITDVRTQATNKASSFEKFEDVDDYPWAAEALDSLVENLVINGISETEFAPGVSVKREEFVKMITAGLRLTGAQATIYMPDVPSDSWYYKNVAAAVRAGIVKGRADGSFGTGSNITREDMAVMLYRAAEFKEMTLEQNREIIFTDDSQIADYAKTAVYAMANSGLLSGMGDGSFEPKSNLTRAEAAVAIYNFLKAADMLSK